MTAVVPAIPWYKSPQLIGLASIFVTAVVALFPKFGVKFGLTSPGAIDALVAALLGLIGAVAAVGAVLRVKSPLQPITLTKATADVHPATLAAASHPPSTVPWSK